MVIAAIPPTMPLAMSPAFKPEVEALEGPERMLGGLEGVLEGLEGTLEVLEGVLEVLEGTLEVLEGVLEVFEGGLKEPGVEPAGTPYPSINVRYGCETLTEERDKGDDSHQQVHYWRQPIC